MESLIAVIGTLSGALATGVLQHRATARKDREERRERRRNEAMDAVAALAEAISNHRRAMWVAMDARLADADPDTAASLRDAAHATRARVTAPAVRLHLLITDPEVRRLADAAVTSTYAIREADTAYDLDARRRAALDAHDAFVSSAADHLHNL